MRTAWYHWMNPDWLKSSDSPDIFEYLCWTDFVSFQFRATAGTGAILAEKDTRCSAFIDVSLETSWASEHQHTFQTQSHFLYSATELEQLKKWYSYFVALRFWSSVNQFCSGGHFKLESDELQAITVYLSPCLCSSVQFNWTHFNV